MPTIMKRDFIFERATKNTYRFAEVPLPSDQGDVVVGVLYVQKLVFGTTQAPVTPDRLRVTIEDISREKGPSV